jgi:hypothetical protein
MPYLVECKTLTLRLDELGRAVSLVHQPSGYEFLSAQSSPVGVWQLGLIRPAAWNDPLPPIRCPDIPYEGHEWWVNRNEYKADLALDSDDAPGLTVSAVNNDLVLRWSVPIPGGTASVTLAIQGCDDQLGFRAEVRLPGDWALKRVNFPRFRGFGDPAAPEDDHLLYPENWGVLRNNPLEDMTQYTGQYPGSVNWCQMTAWLHGQAGLYLGIRDPETHHTGIDVQYVEGGEPAPWEIERWHVRDKAKTPERKARTPLADRLASGRCPAIQVRCNHWPSQTSDWASPHPVVLQGFSGTWFDAAQIHKQWATKQRWCRRGPLSKRSDGRTSLPKLNLWFSRYGFPPWGNEPKPAWEFQKAVHALHDFFRMPFGVHWYHWHAFSWHTAFPRHAPAVEGFREVVAELQSRGIVVMPYCQGRLLYRDRPDFARERTHASVESNGQPYLEMYTAQDDWPLALCPSDRWSGQQWHEAARMLWEDYGVEGVYFDQITAMPPSLCYHAGHGHALGGGTHYWHGYDRALAEMEPMKQADSRRFLSGELLADAYMDRIDLYLAFVPPLEDYVPLFSAIYGGYTTVMGRSCPGAVMSDLQLFAMAQGEQMLFGGQLGWVSDEILEHPEAAVYLRELACLRERVREVLHFGTLEPPLECRIEGERLSLDLPESLCGKPHPVHIERPPIVHTVWRGPDGTVLALFLNGTRKEASVSFAAPADWPRTRWRAWVQGSDEPDPVALGSSVTVVVPSLKVKALVCEARHGL